MAAIESIGRLLFCGCGHLIRRSFCGRTFRPALTLVLAVVPFSATRADDFYWQAFGQYHENAWCGYTSGAPDPARICGTWPDWGYMYEAINVWGRTCCECTPPCPGPGDRAILASSPYNVHVYTAVSVAALEMGSPGEVRLHASSGLAVASPVVCPPGALIDIEADTVVSATIINQGEIDGYINYDQKVTYSGLLQNSGRLFIRGTWNSGANGSALMNMAGGFVDAEGFETDLPITNSGYLWNMAYAITLHNSFTQTAGTLLVNGSQSYTTLNNSQPLEVQGGVVCGAGPIVGHVANSGGVLAPGYPEGFWFGAYPGKITIGSYSQGGGATFRVRLPGDSAEVNGSAALAGTLQVVPLNQLSPGDEYVILTAANVTGQFEHVTGPGQYNITYEPTQVRLTVVDPGQDSLVPTVTISSPTTDANYTTTLDTIDLAGTAADNADVASVVWSNDAGLSGTCAGTTDWLATGIALQPGRNSITVTARDAVGNAGSANIVVTRTCSLWYRDGDADGYGDPAQATESCAPLVGYVADNTDCNDADSASHPGAADVAGDGVDRDCDGSDAASTTGAQRQLTTSVVGGNGAIAPASGPQPDGSVVALVATPDPGYRVKAWQGTDDDASTSETNQVTMDTDKTVRLEFERLAASLPRPGGCGLGTMGAGSLTLLGFGVLHQRAGNRRKRI